MKELETLHSIQQIHDFLGYSSPSHPLITILDYQKIKLDDLEILEARLALYVIVCKEHVPIKLLYGRETYDFQTGTLIFLAPGQTITLEGETEFPLGRGWCIYFHPDLLRKTSFADRIKQYSFFAYHIREALHISEKEKNVLNSCVEKIQTEIDQNLDQHSQQLIVSNLELLLNYCVRFYERQFITRSHFNKDIVTQLEDFLVEYVQSDRLKADGLPNVKQCADQLNLSPNYLSDLLKKETGKTTQEHIHFHLIDKAKTLLLTSSDTINELAYQLGFSYPQYFSKLFKSKTGHTPSQYRELN